MAEYINRDAYIRCLSSGKAEFVDDYGKGWSAGINTAIRACEKFPAADVAPVRHGRWDRVIPSKSAAKWSSKVSCSVCHNTGYNHFKYCPNCGAKMDGGAE